MEVFMASLADEEDSTRKLTNRQKTFARHIVEGVYSNAECARRAGYVPDTAAIYASRLLNGRDFPHVLEYIEELREERERQYGVTTIGQLERLSKLSKGAEEAGQFSAAINAEKIRSALVKTLSSGVLYLFPANQGPELAKGGCSAAQGARFESMGALVEGLRASVLGHYDALRPAPRD
jgi:hypothetical protein